jgi:flagellar hook-associated protein 3 FlgL
MRVTDLTKQHSVIRNVANNSAKLQDLQETMASGKRINRLSDDPIGAVQVQDYRTRLSFIDRLKQNIRANFVWLDRTDAEISHVGDMLMRVKTLILSQANDSADASTRRVAAEEVRDIIEGIVNAGNAKTGKVFLFSGSKTFTQPLKANPAVQPAVIDLEQVPFDAQLLSDPGQFAATLDGWSQNPYIVRIVKEGPVGRAHYVVSDDGGKTWSRPKALLPRIELVNENGKASDKVTLSINGASTDSLGDAVVFPEGLEFRFNSNPPLSYQGNDDKRMVTTGEGILMPLNITGRELFYKDPAREDSVDVLDLLFSLKRALEDNDGATLEQRLADIDHASGQVLGKRADIGAVRKEMEDQLSSIEGREFHSIKQMSEVEDLDFPMAVTEMNLADTRNKATLDTSSRLLQPSLLNFLK